METIIEAKRLSKFFGKKEVFFNINLDIKKGEIYGLIGNNGAGKTTLLRILCGLLKPTFGTVEFCGKKQKSVSIGTLIERPGLYGDMTAYDNLKAKAIGLGIKCSRFEILSLLELVGLTDTGKKQVRAFSMGMKQRLGIALAILGEPELLILDEPINGLDPQGIADMRDIIQKIHNERDVTIILSSHILDELAKIATRICVLDGGNIIKDCTKEEFMAECGDRDLNDYYRSLLSLNVDLKRGNI